MILDRVTLKQVILIADDDYVITDPIAHVVTDVDVDLE